MRSLLFTLVLTLVVFPGIASADSIESESAVKKPNILWLFQEDLSPWIGCYGYENQVGATPTIDAMAARGVRFSRAFVPSPVCSTCRSAMITGAYQIRFGAHEHRSRRGEASLALPEGMKTLPQLMTESAGYFCFNIGKTDYNFEHDGIYQNISKTNMKTPWRACPEGQPFFGQIQLKGGKLNTKKFKNKIDRSKVEIPADYPQNELYREVVAEHFDSVRMDDGNIAKILGRLKSDGLLDSTIVIYFSDHGANNLVRHKQQPTEGGSHVPFIITGPDAWVPAASVRDDLVSMLDLSATTLAWAGVKQPEWMEGQDLFGDVLKPREFVATARDRCDNTIERIRSIRTDGFRFTRNYMLDRVLLQPQYRDTRNFLQDLRKSYADGTLDPKLAEIYFGERPHEELYDIKADPAQLNNLIDDPKYQTVVARHQKLLDEWIAKGDTGAGEEPEIELRMNTTNKWGNAVNPEYEVVRKDDDGDGLSSEWELANGRDPNDGKMLFTFDCGGWQTEGWKPVETGINIPGRQGFLDFDLAALDAGESGRVTLTRVGLNLLPAKNKGTIKIQMRCKKPTEVKFFANEKQVGKLSLKSSDEFRAVEVGEFDSRESAINSLRVEFSGTANSTVEIDWIKID
ncbi:MAG: sulfatase-like hydrolase/transferase [Mariniblastus sp.]